MEPLNINGNQKATILWRSVGLSDQQIGEKLCRSPHTVEGYAKQVHEMVRELTKRKQVDGILVLAVLVARGNITREELAVALVTYYPSFNN